MSDNKFSDTLNQLLDQLETVKTEIEKQNARMKQMEASNAELLEALEGMLELRPDDCSSQIYKIRQKAEKAIQKARGQG